MMWPEISSETLSAIPVRPLPRASVAADRAWFAERCAGSRRSAEAMRTVVPGGIQHNLAFDRPWPLEIVRADGAHLWDVDGNRYVDLLQSGGANLLGHQHPAVADAVAAALRETGPATGLFHPAELRLAELICELVTSVDMFRMLGTGTEAAMAAIRVARVFTGATHVVKIGGGYHGWSDQLMIGMRLPGTGPLAATGVPDAVHATTHEIWPGDIEALDGLLRRLSQQGGVAAVLVEPLGPESGTWPVTPEYQRAVRGLCDEHGALLIYDEVVTGFRIALGGAQEVLGVRPDLTIFGKVVAGGYPGAGGLGGRREVMSVLTGGLADLGRRPFIGGTLAAAGVSCVAGYAALTEAAKVDAPALAARAGQRLTAGLAAIIRANDSPYVVYNFGSIVHLNTTGALTSDLRDPLRTAQIHARVEALQEFATAFAAAGLMTIAGSRLLTSAADTDRVVDDAIARFETVLSR